MKSNRWKDWKEDLDKWEKELLDKDKYPKIILYRASPSMLFIDTIDHSESWLLVRTEEGETVAIADNGSLVKTPEEIGRALEK